MKPQYTIYTVTPEEQHTLMKLFPGILARQVSSDGSTKVRLLVTRYRKHVETVIENMRLMKQVKG